MKRREFMALVCSAAAWPFPARAQQQAGKTYRVAQAWIADPATVKPLEEVFLSVLRDRGYVVGRNLVFDTRYANGEPTRLPGLIDELIALKPDVLTGIEQVVRVMMSKTSTIPIVMTNSSDPIGAGLVKSLAYPGGNVTGVSFQFAELGGKQIEFMREMLPRVTRVGQLHDTNVPASKLAEEYSREAADRLGLVYIPYHVNKREDVEQTYAEMSGAPPDALVQGAGSGLLYGLRRLQVDSALRLRVPFSAAVAEYPKLGALFSYGPNLHEGFALAATYVDRILKGAKPSDLPVEQPKKFELVINLKTAKTLGMTVPPVILARADQVIE